MHVEILDPQPVTLADLEDEVSYDVIDLLCAHAGTGELTAIEFVWARLPVGAEGDRLSALPEDYLIEGHRDEYEQTLALADRYRNEMTVDPMIATRNPAAHLGWTALDGAHRLLAARRAALPHLDGWLLLDRP